MQHVVICPLLRFWISYSSTSETPPKLILYQWKPFQRYSFSTCLPRSNSETPLKLKLYELKAFPKIFLFQFLTAQTLKHLWNYYCMKQRLFKDIPFWTSYIQTLKHLWNLILYEAKCFQMKIRCVFQFLASSNCETSLKLILYEAKASWKYWRTHDISLCPTLYLPNVGLSLHWSVA